MSTAENLGIIRAPKGAPQIDKGRRIHIAVKPAIASLLLAMSGLYAMSGVGALAKDSKKPAATAPAAKSVGGSLPRSVYFNPYPPMVYPVRVGLLRRVSRARFATWTPGALFVNGSPVFELKPGMVYQVDGKQIKELASGRSFTLPGNQRTYISAPDYRVWTDNRWWRGCLEVITFGNEVNIINLLDLEEYLLGVVPAEMPPSWHTEALKAQAIAARSYAWAHMGRGSKWYNSQGYDLVPDVRDQAYKGLAREHPKTFTAVQMTRGLVLKNAGRVKPGFYRAKVGNAMENLNLRTSRVPTTKLENITGVPNIVGVTVQQWDINGNARSVQVMGPSKSREVYGVALSKMLGFSTAGILDVHEEGSGWVFTYRGPGNGARGLSQHGANMLANRGWRFDQILQQYYQDADGQLRLDYLDRYKAPATASVPSSKSGAKKKKGAVHAATSDD